jgi:hypothetical protein
MLVGAALGLKFKRLILHSHSQSALFCHSNAFFSKQVWRPISVHFRRNLPGNSSPSVHMNQIDYLRH